MATSERRPTRVDVKIMYPNFYSEQHKHHVQESSSMAVPQKRRDSSAGSTKRDKYLASTRPLSRNGPIQSKQRVGPNHNGDNMLARQTETSSAERSGRSIPSIAVNHCSNQQESTFQGDGVLDKMTSSLRPPSRHVALRGELSLSSPAWEEESTGNNVRMSPRDRPLPFPAALAGSARSLLEATTARLASSVDGQSLQDLVVNARPRTRYARRELHRQGSARTLARISTAPTTLRRHQPSATPLTSSRSTGMLHSAAGLRPPSRQAVHSAVVQTIEAALPGTEVDDGTDDDDTNFFLTELEAAASAAAAAKLRVLARHVALASFLLYGNPPAPVAAIQHLTVALKSLENPDDDDSCIKTNSPGDLALMALLHHHRGVALRELVVASTSPASKAAMACIKLAFAAQRQALELAQRAQDPRLQARAIKALGLLLLDAHAYGPALAHQQEALQIALEEKDRELEARVYANLGNLALAQMNFGHALSCHHRDLQLCSSKVLDCRLGRARAHRNLSIVHTKLHRRDQQLHHEKEARTAEFNDGGAYLNDVAKHIDSSVGNICFQSTTDIDPALVTLVSQNLAEIVRGLSAERDRGLSKENDDNDSIAAALEQEWSAVDMDLEAAIATVSHEALAAIAQQDRQPLSPFVIKSPSMTALARHVSIRIDNYSSTPALQQSEESLQSQE